MSDLLKLAERVETGDANNAEIAISLRQYPKTSPWIDKNFPQWGVKGSSSVQVMHGDGRTGAYWTTELYLKSLDAAIILLDESLPEWSISMISWSVEQLVEDRDRVRVSIVGNMNDGFPDGRHMVGHAKTPQSALISAILRAKHSENV